MEGKIINVERFVICDFPPLNATLCGGFLKSEKGVCDVRGDQF